MTKPASAVETPAGAVPEAITPAQAAAEEEAAARVSSKILGTVREGLRKSFGADDVPIGLSDESEKLMAERGIPEAERPDLRKQLDGLPTEAQSMWLKTFTDAKVYALSQEDLKASASEYAARTAWSVVDRRFEKKNSHWAARKASIEFDAGIGKFKVDHKSLMKPLTFASRPEAETAFNAISAAAAPTVKVEGEGFSLTHPDWKEAVSAASAEDAQNVAQRKLEDEGWSDTEAQTKAGELVAAAQKEKVMAGIEVKGDAKQGKDGVTGIAPATEGITQGKDGSVKVPGYTSTEGQPGKAVPATTKPLATQNDYAAGAAAHDRMVNQLKSKKGLMTVAASFRDCSAIDVGEMARTITRLFAADMTPEAREFISNKIGILRGEGKDEAQAAAQAYSMAREAGYDVPEPPK
jgi:hypothetical protein